MLQKKLRKLLKNKEALCISCVFFLVVLFFCKVIFFGNSFVYRDIYRYFYPYKLFIKESLANGIVPLWNPYSFCGIPFLATLQSQVFYPISFISYLFPMPWSFNIFIVLHYLLCGLFMYILARHFRISPLSSFLTAVSFIFGGYFLSVLDMVSTLSSVTWFPLSFLFFDKLLKEEKNNIRNMILLAFSLSMEILGGEPTIYYLTILIFGFYTFANLGYIKRVLYKLLLLAIGVVSSFLLASFQIMPFIEYLLHSDRIHHFPVNRVTAWAVSFRHFLTLFFPFLFGDMMLTHTKWYEPSQLWLKSMYCGLPVLMLSFIAIASSDKKRLFWFFTFILGISLTLGNDSPVYSLFFYVLPGFKLIRYPAKFMFLVAFSVSMLAGIGMDNFMNIKNKRIYILFLMLIFSFFMFLVFIPPSKIASIVEYSIYSSAEFKAHIFPLIKEEVIINNAKSVISTSFFIFLMFFSIVFLLRFKVLRYSLGVFLLFMLILFDLFIYGYGLNPMVTNDVYKVPSANAVFLRDKLDNHRLLNIYFKKSAYVFGKTHLDKINAGKIMLLPSTSLAFRFFEIDGYESVKPLRNSLLLGCLKNNIKMRRGKYLTMMDVKYVTIMDEELNSPLLKLEREDLLKIYKYTGPVSRMFFVNDVKPVDSIYAALDSVLSISFDPLKNAVVETKNKSMFLQRNNIPPKINAKIIQYSLNNVKLIVDNSDRVFFVFADAYYPGWRAYIDGKSKKIYPANVLFRGLYLDKGRHTIIFKFFPLSFYIGCVISLLSFGILIYVFYKSKAN